MGALVDGHPVAVGSHRDVRISLLAVWIFKNHFLLIIPLLVNVFSYSFISGDHLAVLQGDTEILIQMALRPVVDRDVIAAVVHQVNEPLVFLGPVVFPGRTVNDVLVQRGINYFLIPVVVKRRVAGVFLPHLELLLVLIERLNLKHRRM